MFLKLIVLSPISKKKLKQVQKRFQKGCKISFEYEDGGLSCNMHADSPRPNGYWFHYWDQYDRYWSQCWNQYRCKNFITNVVQS